MKGDFTRSTFRPEQHYSSVRMQQGRVQLDADWNEQIEIAAHRNATASADTIGGCGGPLNAAGFSLTGSRIPIIGKGRYYVGGILCENERKVPLDQQPDLPVDDVQELISPYNAKGSGGTYLAYLDVWERHLTVLEDPAIREVALGGPDTATRTQTVWQVKLLGPLKGPQACTDEPPEWKALVDHRNDGTLNACANPVTATPQPCVVPPGGGYRRLENQLYRVEVHEVDTNGKVVRLKWSRDNGSILTRWLDQKASAKLELIVAGIGRDQVLGFAPGHYVEVSDDRRDLHGQAGILVRLASAEGQVLTLDSTDLAASVNKDDFPDTRSTGGPPNNPKVRRWDGVLDNPVSDQWIELEDGVQIQLDEGRYRVGDYWLIPARTATADVEWPRDASGEPIPQPPAGVVHRYCRLAILEAAVLDKAGLKFDLTQDCRRFFPPLTGLSTLLYEGGDGQEAAPGAALPASLSVRVINGQAPVAGERVRFAITQGGGTLSGSAPVTTATATTGADGLAECTWILGASGAQQATAVLLDAADKPVPGQILHFGASLGLASRIAYDPALCTNLADAKTVQDAIDILCKTQTQHRGCCVCVGAGGDYETLDLALKDLYFEKEERDLCICLLHGDHETHGMEIADQSGLRDRHIQILGCGPGSRLTLLGPLRFSDLASVSWREVSIETAFTAGQKKLMGALTFEHCAEVRVQSCHLCGYTLADQGTLLSIVDADCVRLGGNAFEALLPDSLVPVRDLLTRVAASSNGDAVQPLGDIFDLWEHHEHRPSVFTEAARKAAEQLAGRDRETRYGIIRPALDDAIAEAAAGTGLSPLERRGYERLSIALGADPLPPATVLGLLCDIRRAAIKSRPGTAIVLVNPRRRLDAERQPALAANADVVDEDDIYRLDNNEIAGVLSLYGPPAPTVMVDELFGNREWAEKLQAGLSNRRIAFPADTLGTLQLRGNQMVRVTLSAAMLEDLLAAAQSVDQWRLAYDLFARCQWSDNVFEGNHNLLLCIRLTMHGIEFTGVASSSGARVPGAQPAAMVIADASIYLANRGTGQSTLRNLSRLVQDVANQEIDIS